MQCPHPTPKGNRYIICDIYAWKMIIMKSRTQKKKNSSTSRRQQSHVENAGPPESRSGFFPLGHVSLMTQSKSMCPHGLLIPQLRGKDLIRNSSSAPLQHCHSIIWLCTNIGETNTVYLNKRKELGANLGYCQFCGSLEEKMNLFGFGLVRIQSFKKRNVSS